MSLWRSAGALALSAEGLGSRDAQQRRGRSMLRPVWVHVTVQDQGGVSVRTPVTRHKSGDVVNISAARIAWR